MNELEVKVVEPGDEVQAQAEATTVEDAEHFESTKDVLNGYAFAGQALIGLYLLWAQWILLAFLIGSMAVTVLMLNALKAPVA